MPRARSRSTLPTLPGSRRRSPSSRERASAPTVSTPAARSRSSAFGPTPGSRRTSSGARNAASCPGTTTMQPAGLARVAADLRDDLARRDAERAREARRRAHRRLHRLGDDARLEEVAGDLARDRGSPRRCRSARPSARSPRTVDHTRARVLAVERVARPHEDGMRAAADRLRRAHRRVDPEPARDVVRRRDDAAPARVAADDRAAASAARGSRAPRPPRRTRRDPCGRRSRDQARGGTGRR